MGEREEISATPSCMGAIIGAGKPKEDSSPTITSVNISIEIIILLAAALNTLIEEIKKELSVSHKLVATAESIENDIIYEPKTLNCINYKTDCILFINETQIFEDKIALLSSALNLLMHKIRKELPENQKLAALVGCIEKDLELTNL
ncbi:MAG: hypothetical protein ABH830_00580 [Patescibacteria group bacterium]